MFLSPFVCVCAFLLSPKYLTVHICLQTNKYSLSVCVPIDGWNKFSHPYSKKEFGKWELIVPPKHDNAPAVDHNTKLKVEN